MDTFEFDRRVAQEICRYAKRLCRRGLVHNTLGNIAVRAATELSSQGFVYTKHRGVSLEEATVRNIVVTNVTDGDLVHGSIPPSIGHQLSRAIFLARPEARAVIHVHANSAISFFSVGDYKVMPFLSIDTPLIIGSDVLILDKEVNVELEVHKIHQFIQSTNSFIMPNHGVTTLGRTLSEAYHRLTSLIAETDRLMQAVLLARSFDQTLDFISETAKEAMFRAADDVLYGASGPQSPAYR